MIAVTKRLICDSCDYEVPNSYYFGTKTWIFARINGEERHFCSQDCVGDYLNDYTEDGTVAVVLQKIKDGSQEMNELLD